MWLNRRYLKKAILIQEQWVGLFLFEKIEGMIIYFLLN